MNTGLLAILVNCSQTDMAGTAFSAFWEEISVDDERGIGFHLAPYDAPQFDSG